MFAPLKSSSRKSKWVLGILINISQSCLPTDIAQQEPAVSGKYIHNRYNRNKPRSVINLILFNPPENIFHCVYKQNSFASQGGLPLIMQSQKSLYILGIKSLKIRNNRQINKLTYLPFSLNS